MTIFKDPVIAADRTLSQLSIFWSKFTRFFAKFPIYTGDIIKTLITLSGRDRLRAAAAGQEQELCLGNEHYPWLVDASGTLVYQITTLTTERLLNER